MEGTFLVNDCLACIMFDSGVICYCIARKFIIAIGLRLESLLIPLEISNPIGRVALNLLNRAVSVSLGRVSFSMDLVVLSMSDFDIIIGIDWMMVYRVQLDYFAKTIIVKVLN